MRLSARLALPLSVALLMCAVGCRAQGHKTRPANDDSVGGSDCKSNFRDPDQSLAQIDFRSAQFSVSSVANAMGCEEEPAKIDDAINPDLTLTSWSHCSDSVEVQLLAVDGASHAWMGHPTPNPRLIGEAYDALDASVAVIEFLMAHPRNRVG